MPGTLVTPFDPAASVQPNYQPDHYEMPDGSVVRVQYRPQQPPGVQSLDPPDYTQPAWLGGVMPWNHAEAEGWTRVDTGGVYDTDSIWVVPKSRVSFDYCIYATDTTKGMVTEAANPLKLSWDPCTRPLGDGSTQSGYVACLESVAVGQASNLGVALDGLFDSLTRLGVAGQAMQHFAYIQSVSSTHQGVTTLTPSRFAPNVDPADAIAEPYEASELYHGAMIQLTDLHTKLPDRTARMSFLGLTLT